MNIQGLTHNQTMVENHLLKKTAALGQKPSAFEGVLGADKARETDNMKKYSEMVENIDKVKTMLEHELTIENLEKYKEALRSFLNYYTKNELMMENFYVKDSRTFMEKRVGIIKTIDEKMNGLTAEMLETNRGHLETLHQIGEIQGLVVNLLL